LTFLILNPDRKKEDRLLFYGFDESNPYVSKVACLLLFKGFDESNPYIFKVACPLFSLSTLRLAMRPLDWTGKKVKSVDLTL
jgi:hypothetical protein